MGLLRIKVAKSNAGVLEKLDPALEVPPFTTYMGLIKDAGVRLQITSGDPDNFQTAVDVYYDPLILDNTGKRLDGTANTPVQDAINAFLSSLPFNGIFSYNSYIAALEAIDGVVIGEPTVAQANYGTTAYVNIMTATPSIYVPDAGYLILDAGYFTANVNYIPYTA